MTVLYIAGGIMFGVVVFIVWCLHPLHLRIKQLNSDISNLAILGEDWYGEMEEIQYYHSQSTLARIRFCIAERSRQFDVERMMESEMLQNDV